MGAGGRIIALQVGEAAGKIQGARLGLRVLLDRKAADQEEARDEMEVEYQGPEIDVGFNVNYLLDVLNNLKSETVQFTLQDGNSSALVTTPGKDDFKYVVMPMRI